MHEAWPRLPRICGLETDHTYILQLSLLAEKSNHLRNFNSDNGRPGKDMLTNAPMKNN